MIPSIRSGVLFAASSLARVASVKWAPDRYKSMTITAIRSFSDEQTCSSCKTIKKIADRVFRDVLLNPGTYKAVRELVPECVEIKNDSFENSVDCMVAKSLREANRDIDISDKINVIFEDRGTTEIFMSAFLKQDSLRGSESDLTGDEGKLALEIIGSSEVEHFNGYVVDIGGQDSSFTKKFISAEKRVVVDKNAIAWALDDASDVQYALGSAEVVLKKSSFLNEESRPQTFFTMSNFINVLPPKFAWDVLEAVIGQMKQGDKLIITNLDRDNFLETKVREDSGATEKVTKKKYYEDVQSEFQGIHAFNKRDSNSHYKSTIGDSFVPTLLGKSESLRLIEERKTTLDCKVRSDKALPVQFRTMMFEKT